MNTSHSQWSLRSFRLFLVAAALVVLPNTGRAQVGNDNPTGTSGIFGDLITTAGSYSDYTACAHRSVTDLTVASVGAYPLAFTRTMNTRYTPGVGTWEFGQAGSWRHSYQWSIDTIIHSGYGTGAQTWMPPSYSVNYPDGRRVIFASSFQGSDSYFRATKGVRDRFDQLTNGETECYLLLPDGGKVWFHADISRESAEAGGQTLSTFDFTFKGLIDPYGQVTTVSYPEDGSMTITEPAGRTLKLFYITTPWNGDAVIDRVVASDGRSVKYNYGGYTTANGTVYTYLGNVVYFGDSSIVAIYAYQNDNVDQNGRPLIQWAIDCMYGGPMWAIAYTFVPGSPDDGVYGQLQSENYLDPRTGTPGAPVSTIAVNGATRTETRGDGFTRTLTYTTSLISYTDFKQQSASLSYDANGYVNTTTDQQRNTTDITNAALTGNSTQVTFPLTPPDTVRAFRQYEYGSATCPDPYNRDGNRPYYLYRATNERDKSITYLRDENKRVIQVNYPDNAYETFSYNGFGQVLTHRMTSGGTESFRYDEGIYPARGLRTSYIPPATPSDAIPESHPTRYHYDARDRVDSITDPRGNVTSYQYNDRGQITRVTHESDGSFIQIGYDNHGNRISVTDELNHTTSYGYDDYNRVVSVTNALNQTASYVYAQDWAHPYLQTTSNVKGAFSPLGKQVHYGYDENWCQTVTRIPPGTGPGSDSNDSWTIYGYDEVGNVAWVQDPQGNVTAFGYDQRNRKIWMDSPIAADRNSSGHTMNWEYDGVGKQIKETRADGAFRSWDYDALNRLSHAIDWRMSPAEPAITTTYTRDVTDTTEHLIDPKGGDYTFEFDVLHRKIQQNYPSDVGSVNRYETWEYDPAGNLYRYQNRSGRRLTFGAYDSRNRPTSFSWDDNNITQGQSFVYDDAGNVKELHNAEADVVFNYDATNRKTSETETIKSYGLNQTHTVTYEYDADGNRSRYVYPQGLDYRLTYTQRNELAKVQLAWAGTPTVDYIYDPAGNRTRRNTYFGAYTDYHFNPLNQLDSQASYFANGVARFDYGFDAAHRIKYEQRDSGVADGFGYDARNELTGFNQNGTLNANGTVSAAYNVLFTYDANGNRIEAYDGNHAPYVTAPSNQYTSDWTGTLNYDDNENLTGRAGWTYTYDAQSRLVAIDGGNVHIHQHYDPLNRIVARDTNGDITTNIWDNWNLIEERTSGDVLRRLYFWGAGANEIVASYGPAYGDLFYFQDGRGNVTHLADPSNTVVERYTYFVSGQPNTTYSTRPNLDNQFLFGGARYIREAEIYDMRNRFYHPNLGRFMQSDPIGFDGGDSNLYRYCSGDPTNSRDPDGLAQVTIFGGRRWGGYVTFGYNNGQFNFAGYVGGANGLVAIIDPFASAARHPGTNYGLMSAAGYGQGIAGTGVTSYIGSDRSTSTFTGRLGKAGGGPGVGGGIRIDNNGLPTPVGPQFIFGRGMFVGIGANHYNDVEDDDYVYIPDNYVGDVNTEGPGANMAFLWANTGSGAAGGLTGGAAGWNKGPYGPGSSAYGPPEGFGPYGSMTPAAAAWEASWGLFASGFPGTSSRAPHNDDDHYPEGQDLE